MAIVKSPGLSMDASGNVGGVCFSKYRGLSILKSAWTGTVPNTTKQVVLQGHMTGVSQAWGGLLNADERASWERTASVTVWIGRMGIRYVPTGYQLYMKWNMRRKVMGLVIMKNAPVAQEWVHVDEFIAFFFAGTPSCPLRLIKEIVPPVYVSSYGVEFYKAGPYDSGGRKPLAGEWLYLAREVPPDTYYDVDIALEKWYWYKARAVSEFGDVQNWFQKQVYTG